MWNKLPLEKELSLLLLTTDVAKAYNNLDVSFIENKLADDVVYESQQVLVPLRGKPGVVEYLQKKFETISSTPDAMLYVELAFLENLSDSMIPVAFAQDGQPCLIMAQGSPDKKLAVVVVHEFNGLISRIDLCTVAPHWSQAKGTGEFPR